MPQVAAAAAVVGGGIAIYGAIKSANDQASLDQERAEIAKQQAQEIAAREQANEALRNQQAYRQKLQFGSSFAASGRAGVGIGSQLQIQNQSDLASMMSNREAEFQEKMLYQQAGIDTTLSNQALESGTISAIGAGLSAGGKAYADLKPTGYTPNPQSLGNYPSAGAHGGG